MLIRAHLAVPDVGQIEAFVEPWQRLYGHFSLIPTLVLFLHLAALVAGGGLALASDRATLRLDLTDAAARDRHLAELRSVHRPIAIALGAAFASGLLLFLADVEAFATSSIFWIKLALVAMLLGNGVAVRRIERSLRGEPRRGPLDSAASVRERLWRRRRMGAMASVAIWFVLVLAGTALSSH
jgi:hypothetical protein